MPRLDEIERTALIVVRHASTTKAIRDRGCRPDDREPEAAPPARRT
ncbi:hypothetical protein [Salinilacihabitans rarus]|nr:hypothetical protein [Salinilacihabitans rarus]